LRNIQVPGHFGATMSDVSELEKLRETAETEMLNLACSDGVIVDCTFAIIDASSIADKQPKIIARELKKWEEGEEEATVQIPLEVEQYKTGVPYGMIFMNYKIVNKQGNEFVVHINRLKKSYDQTPWSFENKRHPRKKSRLLDTETLDGDMVKQSRPIVTSEEREPQVVEAKALDEERLQLDQDPQVHGNIGTPVADAIGGKYLILLYRIQTINPQILHAPGES